MTATLAYHSPQRDPRPGDTVRHSVGRGKPTEAIVRAVRPDGLLVVQTPGEGFGKFVSLDQLLPKLPVDNPGSVV